jgi:hypothetical protein
VYEAIFTEKGTSTVFVVDMGRLGNHVFLDVEPARATKESEWATHSFYKVQFLKDRLSIAHFEEGWLVRMLNQGRVKLSHKTIANKVVLTAPTDSLQKFVLQHAMNKEAFPKPTMFALQK